MSHANTREQIYWKGSPCPKPVVGDKSILKEWFHAGLRAWHYNLGDPVALKIGEGSAATLLFKSDLCYRGTHKGAHER